MNKNPNRKLSVVYAIGLSAALLVTGCEQVTGNKSTVYQGASSSNQMKEQQTVTGVVTKVDDSLSQITFRELDSQTDNILNYNVATNITDEDGNSILPDEIPIGAIMEAEYESSNAEILKMSVPSNIWEHQDADQFSIKTDENMLCVAGSKYEIGDQTCFLEHGKKLEPSEINTMDVLTIRGRGYQVYSVVREKGHGYLTLQNYKDYIGGMIDPGDGNIYHVTKNMLLTLPVGKRRIVMWKNDGLKAQKTVVIKANRETTADFSDCQQVAKGIGTVTFQIAPAGADLIVNGKRIDYSKPVRLRYGVYQVVVSMTGYTTYQGTLDVEEAKSTINIDLVEQQANVADSTATPEPTAKKDDDNSQSTNAEQNIKTDQNHTISVKGPDGAAVYVDNVYKGLSPCKFTKTIGSQTLTFMKEGYDAKSYNINIEDDDKNVTLTFPELQKSS